MKKSRVILSVLTAAALAVSVSALAACSKSPSGSGDGDGNGIVVTFDANGGTFEGGETTVTRETVGGKILLPPDEPTISDDTKEFKGYTRVKDEGSIVVFSVDTFEEATIVYALWGEKSAPEPTTYTITFDAGEGTFGADGRTVTRTTDGNGKVANLPTPDARDGYVFDYFVDSANAQVSTSTVFTANATVTAHWTVVQQQQQPPTTLDGNSVKITFSDGDIGFKFVGPDGWESWDGVSEAHIYFFNDSGYVGPAWDDSTEMSGGAASISANSSTITKFIVWFNQTGGDYPGSKQTDDLSFNCQVGHNYVITFTGWGDGGKLDVTVSEL